MSLQVKYFGKFELTYDGRRLTGIRSQRTLEVLAYLLLKRSPQSRDSLASLVWGDHASTEQARKYLRNALWQLQKRVTAQFGGRTEFLVVDGRLISVDPDFPIWSDIEEFESQYEQVRDVDGAHLTDEQVEKLRQVVTLHTGPFLEGWFSEWCLAYRERTQHLVLIMLDKLMASAAARGQFEFGILWGERILSYDRAREVTHRNLMKLFYLSGDRTSALRQFQLCQQILKEELEIEPSELTREVLRAIRDETMAR